MGLLATRWEAEYEGHSLVVRRNELTKGFALDWDGEEIAHRTWSLVGLGELQASAETSGGPVEVKVSIHWESFSEMDGSCVITVNGREIPVRHVK